MIIGLTGSYCSGKDTVAEFLREKDFLHISLSDILRNELNKTGRKISRSSLIKLANDLREKFGPSVLARIALSSMIPNTNYVVSSIRNLYELEVLRSNKSFVLIDIESPIKQRFSRLLARSKNNEDDKILTFEEFKRSEDSEKSDDDSKQQLHVVSKQADVVINNSGSLKELYAKLDSFLNKWKPKLAKRPSWDEYFINIMHAVGSRGTCERGRAGAIIVRNKRILATGYVGSPAGLPHCYEVGHEFQKKINDDGSYSMHCIRTTHAEVNAIAQAARHGTSIEGGTVYVKMTPCYDCAKMIINSGIKRVVAERDYHASKRTKEIFKIAGIELDILYKETLKYGKQK